MNLISIFDLSQAEIEALIETAKELKRERFYSHACFI
jgi:ornithine carbamoyltransferase